MLMKRIFPEIKIIIIPSWGRLTGYPQLGTYRNHDIINIAADPVIFVSFLESTVMEKEKYTHFYFGMGYYYTKFQIDKEKYITDHRCLTGLALADFAQAYLQRSKNLSTIDVPGIVIKEDVYMVPLLLNDISDQKINFLKGLLNRQVFSPYKSIIKEFLEEYQKWYQPGMDPEAAILSATHGHFNELRLFKPVNYPETQDKSVILQNFSEEKMKTAGIKITTAEDRPTQLFSEKELVKITQEIQSLAETLLKGDINLSDPFSFFKSHIKPSSSLSPEDMPQSIVGKIEQHGLFLTSPNLSEILSWPEADYPRKSPEFWGLKPDSFKKPPLALAEQKFLDGSSQNRMNLEGYQRGPSENTETFELNVLKRPKIERKSLPPMPEDSVKEILVYLKYILADDYEKKQIGEVFAEARDRIHEIALHSPQIVELSKISNIFLKEKPGYGLNQKEKEKALWIVHEWLTEVEVAEEKEAAKLAENLAVQKELEELQQKKETEAEETLRSIFQEKMKRKQQEEAIRAKFRERVKQSRLAEQASSKKQTTEAFVEPTTAEDSVSSDQIISKIAALTQTLLNLKVNKPKERKARKAWKKEKKAIKKQIKQKKKELKKYH